MLYYYYYYFQLNRIILNKYWKDFALASLLKCARRASLERKVALPLVTQLEEGPQNALQIVLIFFCFRGITAKPLNLSKITELSAL